MAGLPHLHFTLARRLLLFSVVAATMRNAAPLRRVPWWLVAPTIGSTGTRHARVGARECPEGRDHLCGVLPFRVSRTHTRACVPVGTRPIRQATRSLLRAEYGAKFTGRRRKMYIRSNLCGNATTGISGAHRPRAGSGEERPSGRPAVGLTLSTRLRACPLWQRGAPRRTYRVSSDCGLADGCFRQHPRLRASRRIGCTDGD